MKPTTPQQLIERLIERNWLATHIADECGVDKSTISRIQAGAQPKFELAQKLMNLVSSRRKGPARKKRNVLADAAD